MCFKKSVLLVLSFFLYFNADAQNFKYGKVSKEELQQSVHTLDSTAVAAIIFKKAKTYFVYETGKGFYIYHDYEMRIKVYKKEGVKWGDFKVFYFGEDGNPDSDNIIFFNCVTYNLENDIITQTNLRAEGNLKTKINRYWNETLINMPNVKIGSVFEIKYSVKTRNTNQFPVFNFQYDIPVNYVEYFTEIPEKYIYKTILTGYNKISVTDRIVEEKESYSYKFNEYSLSEFKYKQSEYTVENIPGFREDSFIDNVDNYRSSIQHELEGFRSNKDELVENYSITWDGVAAYIYNINAFGVELNRDSYFDSDLKNIITYPDAVEAVKLEKIFKFVQNKMQWTNEYSIYTNKGVKKAYKEETGNTAEINLILIAMLKSAGIKTHPVLISTRDNGVPVYPNRNGFNSVIAAAEIDGEQILLDATNKYCSVGILPLEDLNWKGRLIKEDGSSKEIDLVPKKASNENVNLVASIDNRGKISGQARVRKTDYEALNYRERKRLLSNDEYIAKKESELGGILIEKYKIVDDINLSTAILENFDFVSNNHCDVIEGKMYINPLLFYNETKNPFFQQKRLIPIYFGYPRQMKYNINIEIPKGYKVESLPSPIKISAIDNIASFSFNLQTEGNKIQIAVTEELSLAMVPADYYDALKDFFQKMIDKQNEKIVLVKM